MSGRLILSVLGVACLGFGAFGLFLPDRLADFVGLMPTTPLAWSELRTLYGGLWGFMGLVILGGLRSEHGRLRIRGIGLAWVGLLVGRGVSLGLDGLGDWKIWVFFAVEAVMVYALFRGVHMSDIEAARAEGARSAKT